MRYRGAFLLSGGYRRASRERVAHDGQGLREEGNGAPEMAGPLLGDARSAPALGMFFVVPETYQCGTKRPLMVSAAGKKEGARQVISQVAKVAGFILAQFAQQLAQLGRGVVAQLGFLRGELWRKTLGKGIWRIENVIEEGERSFDLEVMRGTSAACCLLIELLYPFCWEGLEDEAFRRRPCDYFEPSAPVGDE